MFVKEQFLELAELKQLLSYNSRTGVFTRRIYTCGRATKGSIAGNKTTTYRLIYINGYSYQAHRLAWFYYYGVWPKHFLDHKDGDFQNNSIKNLREATARQNVCNNKRKEGRFGHGVCRWGKRFAARARANDKRIVIGVFDTPDEAEKAHIRYVKIHHGEFSVYNR